ncbi:TetR/AcrR family transcriptional regulator [Paracoccus sp. P2]|uniref:TetR family transcriptional regulator n=1 Tax=Paracoccus pantotrophus TaxID=82367 RepID=A0A1I5ML43_PARPN|nr:TetR family transcriptional regulator [Paracoccus pantotrophus]MDF3856354.1 TetR family transcriptional regulator [Paracoccus pantotrophus]QFG36059.1 TetR/AcrR family transcriptional regulator [Paracoccus pantotrophus]QLH12764.1 TetR family transcriptional regulator [Paracoccus pantotrophus]RDD96412.1 TetR/AcrR family transcriptional regulator [Paracoccus pantotrophus]RKS43850.1 TetR family transcriptional regulator [Paracoccus pantotrophus]
MGRKRTIDRDELMGAIERVARRSGITGLSIDAVAKEAGISKSSVVYDCESKAGLLAAFIRHKMAQHQARFVEIRARREGEPNARLRALIDEYRRVPTDEELDMALLISASMGEHAECREIMREKLAGDAETVAAQAADRRRMLMALLTLHGMAFLEYFGFHRFDQETRDEILDELMAVAESDPGAAGD